MSCLMGIKEEVQKFAEVMENVLGVDVTIVDDTLTRVAATGKYKDLIEKNVSSDTVFGRVIVTGKGYIIENPRNSYLCDTCSKRDVCTECAEVCCPISFEGETIGVIGLVAFEDIQREALLSNKDSLLQFINQMADLIASKAHERDVLIKNTVLTEQLETIINTIDEGIIAISHEGYITHCSNSARTILKISETDVLGRDIGSIFPEFAEKVKAYKNKIINNKEFVIKKSGYIRGIFSTRPIIFNKRHIGTVIIIREISDIRNVINNVSGLNFNIYFDDIIGTSKAIKDAKDIAMKASMGDSTVFITGESGTGKELFARAIHSYSSRSSKPFVAVNCAAIPETLLESELFGYVEGAFTGAQKGGKMGKFEIANGGTIFLDEIGDMPLYLQTKLLRVLQDMKIDRVGSQYSFPVDVRVIAATNKDILKMLKDGEFRQDLFYRLNVIPVTIPPLRDRKDDVPLLMKYMLKKCNLKLGKYIKDYTDEVYRIFEVYMWPGNIRELENTVEYAVNMETGDHISLLSLPPRFKNEKTSAEVKGIVPMNQLEREAIINALKTCGYDNKEEAANALGISRATFYRKLKEYGISK